MADIIDFEFYRKFKVVLPMYSPALDDDEMWDEEEEMEIKPCRKRRKATSSYGVDSKSRKGRPTPEV